MGSGAASGAWRRPRRRLHWSPPGCGRWPAPIRRTRHRALWRRSSAILSMSGGPIAWRGLPTRPPRRWSSSRRRRRAKASACQRQARAIRFKGDIADFDSPASGVCLRICSRPVAAMSLACATRRCCGLSMTPAAGGRNWWRFCAAYREGCARRRGRCSYRRPRPIRQGRGLGLSVADDDGGDRALA